MDILQAFKHSKNAWDPIVLPVLLRTLYVTDLPEPSDRETSSQPSKVHDVVGSRGSSKIV
jgi:hypothetical protein